MRRPCGSKIYPKRSAAPSDNPYFNANPSAQLKWHVVLADVIADSKRGMPVQLICPNLLCRKFLAVPEDARGKLVRCQHCQCMLRVPEAKSTPTTASRERN